MTDFWHILPTFQLLGDSDTELPVSPYKMIGSTAVIPVVGPTSKYGGWGSASTIKIREQVRQASEDATVESVMMHFDTPGGQVAGNVDLAKDVAALSQTKPTFAYASDLLASAGYEVASQCGRIYANDSALVGSIGTMSSLTDYSKMAENIGIKVIPITSGGMKGAGMPGTPVTQDQINYYQNLIDTMNNQFVSLVASGRNMDANQARGLADGRVHIAADAAKLGMIDGIAPLEQAVTDLQEFSNQRIFAMYSSNGNTHPAAFGGTLLPAQQQAPAPQPEPQAVAPQPAVPVQAAPQPAAPAEPANAAATIEQLESACPGAPADFVLSQFKAQATVQVAQTAFIVLQNQELQTLKTAPAPQLVPAQAAVPQVPQPAPVANAPAPVQQFAPGNAPVLPEPTQAAWGTTGSPAAMWSDAIKAEETAIKQDAAISGQTLDLHTAHQRAVFNADAKNPGLREAYLATLQPNPQAPKPGH